MRNACRLHAAALVLLAPAPLAAGAASGTMAVSLTVEEACHLDTRPMVFGTVLNDAPHADASSELAMSCTPAVAYTIGIDEGLQGANGHRRMAGGGGGFVAYDIYRDPARTQRWGAGPAGGLSGIVPASGAVLTPIYGRASTVAAPADSYSDIVTVTVAF